MRTARQPRAPIASVKLLDQGTALQPRIDTDDRRRCLYKFFKTSNLNLLGDSRTDHRPYLRLVWMATR